MPKKIIQLVPKVAKAAKKAEKPASSLKTYKTTDGYTFYRLPEGKVVDNLDPEKVDMSWDSEKQFLKDMEGTAYEEGDELGQRRSTIESLGVPTQEKLLEKISEFGEDDTSKFYAARKKQIEDAERRANISAVPSPSKMDPQDFVRFAEKGMIRWAKDKEMELRDFLEGKSKFAELYLDWDDPSTYELIDSLESQGFKSTVSKQGPSNVTYLYRDPEDVELILRAQNPAQYGKAYGYSDEDIARFYWERGLGPGRYAEDMATVPKPEEEKAAGGTLRKLSGLGTKAAETAKKAKAPPIKASEALGKHEGKTLMITEADRTKVGEGFLGGPGFSSLQLEDPFYGDVGAVWGVGKPSKASTMIAANKRLPEGEVIWSTFLGKPDQHKSNQMVFDSLLKEFKTANKAGKLSDELKQKINDRLADAVDKDGRPIFPADVDITSPKFRNLANTFDRRAVAASIMGGEGVGGKKGQIIDYESIIQSTTDPDLIEAPTGAVGNRLFTLSNEVLQRPDLHPAFPSILTGEDLGVNFSPVIRDLIMRDYIKSMMETKGRMPGQFDYTRGYAPMQLLDEAILTKMQKEGYAEGGKVDNDLNDRHKKNMASGGIVKLGKAVAKAVKKSTPPTFGGSYDNSVVRRAKEEFVTTHGMDVGQSLSKDYDFVDIDKIKPAEKVSEKRVEELMKALENEDPFHTKIPPVIIDSEGNVLDGHHRIEAAKRLGIKSVPAIEKFETQSGTKLLNNSEQGRAKGGVIDRDLKAWHEKNMAEGGAVDAYQAQQQSQSKRAQDVAAYKEGKIGADELLKYYPGLTATMIEEQLAEMAIGGPIEVKKKAGGPVFSQDQVFADLGDPSTVMTFGSLAMANGGEVKMQAGGGSRQAIQEQLSAGVPVFMSKGPEGQIARDIVAQEEKERERQEAERRAKMQAKPFSEKFGGGYEAFQTLQSALGRSLAAPFVALSQGEEAARKFSEDIKIPESEYGLYALERTGEFLDPLAKALQESKITDAPFMPELGFTYIPGLGRQVADIARRTGKMAGEAIPPALKDLPVGMSIEAVGPEGKKLSVNDLIRMLEAGEEMTPEQRQKAEYSKAQKEKYAQANIAKAEKKAAETTEYRGLHTAPDRESGAPLFDVTGGGTMYPDDIYSSKAAQYYGHFGKNDPMDQESISIIQSMRGEPDADVMIYRAVPKDEKITTINPGDWVTINPDYAKQHGESVLKGEYKIVSKKVPAKNIFTNADSIHEFGYDPIVPKKAEEVRVPATEQGFFSSIEKAAANLKREEGSGSAFLSDIMKFNPSKGELEATGIVDFLKGKKSVTRQEVQDYIDQHGVQIEEVTLGTILSDAERKKLNDINRKLSKNWPFPQRAEDIVTPEEEEWFEATKLRLQQNRDPRFEKENLILPGGKNYKEILLKFPSVRPSLKTMSRKDYDEAVRRADELGLKNFETSHWPDDPNTFMHLRMQDMTIGGKKTLVIEEIQSDWHQQGRKQGYNPKNIKNVELKATINTSANEPYYEVRTVDGQFVANIVDVPVESGNEGRAIAEAQRFLRNRGIPGAVPDAPFKKDWYQLGVKRLLRYAADNDYDQVALVGPDEQIRRGSLGTHIDGLIYEKNADGTIKLMAEKGESVVLDKTVEPKDLDLYVGKDVAKRILESKETDGTLTGDDLKIGGEGMRQYYGRNYPEYMNKLGRDYGTQAKKTQYTIKEFGPNDVEEVPTGEADRYGREVMAYQIRDPETDEIIAYETDFEKALKEANKKAPSTDMWVMDLPAKMKSDIKIGQPFKKGGLVEKDEALANRHKAQTKGRTVKMSELIRFG